MPNSTHIDRYLEIRNCLENHHGRQVKAHALVAFDNRGELYWGADWAACSADEANRLAATLRTIAADIERSNKPRRTA